MEPQRERLVGFGAHTLLPDRLVRWDELEARNREMLSHALNLHDTIIFLGAGCSVPLGFPTWQQLACRAVQETARKIDGAKRYKSLLGQFEKQLKFKRIDANTLMFILGACEKMWAQNDRDKGAEEYRKKLAAEFKERKILSDGCNPYARLLELDVHRFVTSNYDCALEEAISKKEGILKEDFLPGGPRFGKQNFTQHAKYDEQLAIFALAMAEHEKRVFHCHGWHHEPDSMVITEADYQRWYLRDLAVGTGRFRQSIDLIFDSNPVLFIGFSLRDDDLLLALRILSAVEPDRKYARPLFALLEKELEASESRFEQIYDRYGVHVISYSRGNKRAGINRSDQPRNKDEADDLCDMFRTLAKCCAPQKEDAPTPPPMPADAAVKQLRDLSGHSPTTGRAGALLEMFTEGIEPALQKSESAGEAHQKAAARATLRKELEQVVDGWERAEALCRELDSIAGEAKKHRAEWLKKPKFRQVPPLPTPPKPYYHYDYTPLEGKAPAAMETPMPATDSHIKIHDPSVDVLIEAVSSASAPKVIVLLGPGGTGKSWLALELLKTLVKKEDDKQSSGQQPQIHGFFFWSSYYTDDALNGTDRALRYFQKSDQAPTISRVDRLRECLADKDKRYILVFDGIERFLHETSEPGIVRSNAALISRFLAAITCEESRSTVVLTSRVLPSELREMEKNADKKDCIKIFPAQGFNVEQSEHLLRNQLKNRKLEKEQVPSLVSWLGGHRYGIALAGTWLNGKKADFSGLLHSMSGTDPEQRVSKMIELSVKALKPDARELLKELAVFTTPMARTLIEQCFQTLEGRRLRKGVLNPVQGTASVRQSAGKSSREIASSVIGELTDVKLLFRVEFDSDPDCYIVHPTVREYIFRHLHHSASGDLPNLTLSGFSSGSDQVYPGDAEGVSIVNGLFATLHRTADPGLYGDDGAPRNAIASEASTAACRSLFGLVRSRMVVNTVPRWTQYENYLGYLVRVIDAARAAPPGCWDYAVKDARDYAAKDGRNKQPQEEQKTPVFEDKNGPLYAGEVAWLYNEAGLAYYSAGSMLDAIAVWEQGYEINRILDSEPEGGQYIFQSLCNLGAANIHFGRLGVAEVYLRHAFDVGQRIKETDHIARVKGYLGLVRHLQGNLQESKKLYGEAIREAQEVGNLRAQSIFLKHQADLLIKEEDRKEAAIQIQASRAAAEAGHYPDLVAYARLSQGHLHRSRKQYSDAIREYRVALAVARRLGIHRLEAEAHSELARVALDLGDAQVARRRAMKTLQIANEHLLGLRQTHGMVVLGKATVEAGDRELGIYYLKHAKRLAERQEYRIRCDEAEAALHRWGEPFEELEVEPLILSDPMKTQPKAKDAATGI